MNTRRLFRFLTLMFLIVLTLSSRTYANATQIDPLYIKIPVSDARLILAEHASLEAQVSVLKEALALERESNEAILKKTEEYINASLEESKLLREQNAGLTQQIDLLNKQMKAEKAKSTGIGVIIGVVLGIAISASM